VSSRFKLGFLQYMGGKSYLVKRLLELLPPHRCYVEVFGGGAKLLFAKEPSRVEVYNDIDGRLVNLFLVVRDRCQEFRERLRLLPYSRRIYLQFSKNLKTGDPLEDAVRFFYVLRCSFSGEFASGLSYGPTKNEARELSNQMETMDLVAARLRNVQVEDLDFRECIKRYDKPWTLFYCDPPYYGFDVYKHGFSERDHEDLAGILRSVKGKWLLTYNDHPRIRHLYAGFPLVIKKLSLRGSLVKGERRMRRWDQLIIANYEFGSAPNFSNKRFFPERVKIPGTGPGFKSQGPKVRSS